MKGSMAGKVIVPAKSLKRADLQINEWEGYYNREFSTKNFHDLLSKTNIYGLKKDENEYELITNIRDIVSSKEEDIVYGDSIDDLLMKVCDRPNPLPNHISNIKIRLQKTQGKEKIILQKRKEPILLELPDNVKENIPKAMKQITSLRIMHRSDKNNIIHAFHPDRWSFNDRELLTKNIVLEPKGSGILYSNAKIVNRFKEKEKERIRAEYNYGIKLNKLLKNTKIYEIERHFDGLPINAYREPQWSERNTLEWRRTLSSKRGIHAHIPKLEQGLVYLKTIYSKMNVKKAKNNKEKRIHQAFGAFINFLERSLAKWQKKN